MALILALLTILILSTLGAAILFSTQAEVTTTYNLKRLTQARYAAEAGAQNTINWLIYSLPTPADFSGFDTTQSPVTNTVTNTPGVVLSANSNVTSNYPDNTAQMSFNNALLNQPVSGLDVGVNYATTASLQTMQVVTPFGQASQAALQTWLITSQASIAGSQAVVQVTTTIEQFGTPVFSYAAFATSGGCAAITFSGGSSTDSYDSSQGTYTATKQNSNGNIGTNGNVSLSGSTMVNGTNSTPYGTVSPGTCSSPGSITPLSASGGSSVTGGEVSLPGTLTLTNPAAPAPPVWQGNKAVPLASANWASGTVIVDAAYHIQSVTRVGTTGASTPTFNDSGGTTTDNTAQWTDYGAITANANLSGSCASGLPGCTNINTSSKIISLAPGPYPNISASGGTTIHLSAGTYDFNKLSLSGGSTLVLDSTPVVVNFWGYSAVSPLPPTAMTSGTVIDFSGGSISDSGGHPSDFQILYNGTAGVNLSGGSGNSAVVYVPNAPVTMSGGSAWYGAIIGKTVTNTGGTSIHYDRSLQNSLVTVGNYHTTAFSWSSH
jgi:hypothetical protein